MIINDATKYDIMKQIGWQGVLMMFQNRNKGFTLIEVIVAIGIIAIIGVMLTGIVSTTLKARTISEERLHILALCTSSLDEIKSNQDDFHTINDLDIWLQANGYANLSGLYKKHDNNTGIDIEVYISQMTGTNYLYQVKVIGRSTKATELSISTVIKGGISN